MVGLGRRREVRNVDIDWDCGDWRMGWRVSIIRRVGELGWMVDRIFWWRRGRRRVWAGMKCVVWTGGTRVSNEM